MRTNQYSDDELLSFACTLADASLPIALRYFRQPLAVETKGDGSPVTRADREIEALLRELIVARYPQHGIFGEEEEPVALQGQYVWVVDPIDGTKSFISGMPTFGTLLAFMDNGRSRIGVIDMPALNERWLGVRGKPTTLNGVACRTRRNRRLAEATIYATTPDTFNKEELVQFDRVSRAAAMRHFGGDCYAYALLASGSIDVVIEAGLKPFDFLSLVPVIEGAGGIVTDWQGQELGLNSDGRVVAAATPALHAELLKGLSQ